MKGRFFMVRRRFLYFVKGDGIVMKYKVVLPSKLSMTCNAGKNLVHDFMESITK